ncbi:MAG: HDIG domain-containing metalloprotein [Veillonellales bacterium]
MDKELTRQEAWDLLTEYTKTTALQKHALAVEAVMKHFAEIDGKDVEKWGIVGLLHDLDYEKYPEEHCQKAAEILRARDIAEEYIHAICSHGYGICSDIEPQNKMEKILYTIDELTGLITAACLVRPSKSILDLEVKSVKKKYKQSSFAEGVNRSIIEKGCKLLDADLNYMIQETILGMRENAKEIGLKGNL